jgi:TPR repeat protein
MVGNGVPRDYSEAYFWLDLAAMGKPGYFTQEKLAKRRDEVASLLSNTALLQAQERARKWLEAHQANPQAKPQ